PLWQSGAALPSNREIAARLRCAAMTRSAFDRHPDLEAAIAGDRIELLVIALEVRRIRDLMPRRRHPVIPDGVDGPPDGRDVITVGEDRVFLRWDSNAAELARQVGEVGDLNAGDIVEIAGVIAVAADAIGDRPDPGRNILDQLVEA